MKHIPFAIILAAKKYDAEAVDFVLRHFEGYIHSRCTNTYTDEYGSVHAFVDDDLYYQAQHALFDAIEHFRFREPPENFQG